MWIQWWCWWCKITTGCRCLTTCRETWGQWQKMKQEGHTGDLVRSRSSCCLSIWLPGQLGELCVIPPIWISLQVFSNFQSYFLFLIFLWDWNTKHACHFHELQLALCAKSAFENRVRASCRQTLCASLVKWKWVPVVSWLSSVIIVTSFFSLDKPCCVLPESNDVTVDTCERHQEILRYNSSNELVIMNGMDVDDKLCFRIVVNQSTRIASLLTLLLHGTVLYLAALARVAAVLHVDNTDNVLILHWCQCMLW